MAAVDSTNYGFDRPEMYSLPVANSVEAYDRHVFLCYKSPEAWPSNVENSDVDPLPKLLASALKARKDDIPLKTRLTICGGCNGDECSDGDLYIFPEMVKYRGLKESDVDAFVDDVLVNGKTWGSEVPESLVGAYVFVCSHGSRDKRCGECGPVLIEKFKEEIQSRDLNDKVFMSACSHVGGHKYAGNLIIFGTNAEGKVTGDWYGYVTPTDVPDLLDVHIGKGEIIEKLWRGQMGLKLEAAEKEENKPTTENIQEKTEEKSQETEVKESTTGCCQGTNAVSCCRDGSVANGEVAEVSPKKASDEPCKKGTVCLPAWAGKWEQSDLLMVGAVVGAVATVAVAYSIFRRSA
ncbi:uncharacterized protein LOC110695668 [Chenopodium quinoa]|uniref:uncharacterized protein LOC110695668 n=1 Tax=Chenopodium quinoa TaxID=63459 RepID=UPI000B7903B4|nr:uncharacterized protein LOC110695668 [Chenopodium quinoa]